MTSQGWRPISVTIQPASVAIHPENVNAANAHSSQRGGRLSQNWLPHASTSMRTPVPTITRNAVNTGMTGG